MMAGNEDRTGDAALADALRGGVEEIVATFGSDFCLRKPGVRVRHPHNPSRYINKPESRHPFAATIKDVEDRLVDGTLVKRGDRQITMAAGGEVPTPEINDKVETTPKLGDKGDESVFVYTVIRVDTNIVANKVVSYRLLLR